MGRLGADEGLRATQRGRSGGRCGPILGCWVGPFVFPAHGRTCPALRQATCAILAVMSNPDAERGSGWQGVDHLQSVIEEFPGGSILSHLIDVMPGVQAHKANILFQQLLEHVATTPDVLVERMRAEPRLQRVLWEAARAAADTELDDKIRGLARIAAQGVLGPTSPGTP
jgi:hypothetical protein